MPHVKHDPFGSAPDADAMAAIARRALDQLPAPVLDLLGGVRVLVDELADDQTLAALGIDHPLDLSGVYHGRPRTGPSQPETPDGMTDHIMLFRQAILAEWVETGVRLDALIAHVLIHEIGHHLGFSDDDMHAIEAGLSRGPSL